MNDTPENHIAAASVALASELPAAVVRSLARVLADGASLEWPQLRLQALQVTPQPGYRDAITQFMDAWHDQSPEVSARGVGLALLTAAAATESRRDDQKLELIWTGPQVADVPLRRTDQALLQVIEAAERSLLVVSFAVYRIPAICEALVRAAGRGVSLRICLESPEAGDQRAGLDPIQALGQEVARRAAVYTWPRDRRPTDPGGRVGSLHAKCAVADDRLLFISSANLTEYAMNLNMELGVLIEGGPLPGRVAVYFGRLMQDGVLRRTAGMP